MEKVCVVYCEHGLGEEVEFAKQMLELARLGFSHVVYEADATLVLGSLDWHISDSDYEKLQEVHYNDSNSGGDLLSNVDFVEITLSSGEKVAFYV